MNDVLFLRGLLIGCSIAAVVGPIGLLCIQRTFYKDYLYGLFLQTSRVPWGDAMTCVLHDIID